MAWPTVRPSPLHPTPYNDLDRPASLGASGGGRFTVRNLKRYRDTYYTSSRDGTEPRRTRIFAERSDNVDRRWWIRRSRPTMHNRGTVCVRATTAPSSADSRSWGLVPCGYRC
jgi:hypothetical protein